MKDRLQKKCMAGSALAHGVLLFVLIFGAAFGRPTKPKDSLPPITLVSLGAIPTDGPSRGGGGGQPAPPAPQPQPQPQPQPEPRRQEQPEPVKPEPVKIPDPPKVKIKPLPAPKPPEIEEKTSLPTVEDSDIFLKEDPKPKKTVKKHEIKPSFDTVVDTGKKAREEQAKRDKEERDREIAEEKAWKNKVASLGKAIGSTGEHVAGQVATSGASATVVDLPGNGLGSGPAFANYRDLVYTYYFRAWIAPDDVMSTTTSVEAKIVVARDGSIISANISKPSGVKGLNESVHRALKKVDHLPPFPKETSDSERSFLIIFDLEAKKSLG